MNSKEQITVVINETDLISREFDDCQECAFACAIQRKTGLFPDAGVTIVNLYSSDYDRRSGKNKKQYKVEPPFPCDEYERLRDIAMNHQKVFHTITLIPV